MAREYPPRTYAATIGIMAHIDAAKPRRPRRPRFHGRQITRIGEVHEGAADMDNGCRRKERGSRSRRPRRTVYDAGRRRSEHGRYRPPHQTSSTPRPRGTSDRVERSLRVLDGAVAGSGRWQRRRAQSEPSGVRRTSITLPRLALHDKMDKVGRISSCA